MKILMFENVDFYEFRFEGKIARMYERQYVQDRAKQMNDNKPNAFLDAFRKEMGFRNIGARTESGSTTHN